MDIYLPKGTRQSARKLKQVAKNRVNGETGKTVRQLVREFAPDQKQFKSTVKQNAS